MCSSIFHQSKIAYNCLKSPNLLNPNLIVKDVTKINFENMKKMGINYLVFDKDNTITITNKFSPFNEEVKNSINEALNIFKRNKIGILSNSIKKENVKFMRLKKS